MATIGRLAVLIDADSTGLKTGLKGAVNETEDSSKKIIKSVQAIATAFAGYLTVDLFTGMVKGAAAAGREIDQLSKLSATSATEFQRQAYATQQLGISNEKLADIFKDVQDKVGQFLRDGGGPMQAFFDQIAPKVGVTAEQFKNLGGPDALQLYVSSLQKANLSQNEMVAYMEELASDSALLLPLLKNNGKAMKEMGDEAERLGAVLDDKTIKANVEFAKRLDQLQASAKSASMAVGSELIPALNQIVAAFSSAEFGTNSFARSLGSGLGAALQSATLLAANTAYVLKTLGDTAGAYGAVSAALVRGDIAGAKAIGAAYKEISDDRRKALDDFEKRLMTPVQSPVVGGGSGQRMGMNDPRIIGTPAAGETAGFRPVVTPKPTDGGASKAVGSIFDDGDPVQAELAKRFEQRREMEAKAADAQEEAEREAFAKRIEALREYVKTEEQITLERQEKQLEDMILGRENGLLTEQEYMLAEQDLALKHMEELARIRGDGMKRIEDITMQSWDAQLGAVVTKMGEMTAAAASGSKAMFNINKVAAIATALLKAKESVTSAYAFGSKIGGPPLGAAMAGVAAAATAGQIAAIKSQSFGGGGSVASGGGTSSVPTQSAAAGGASQSITIQGVSSGDLFSGDAVRTLIDKLIDAQRNGARIVLA